MRCGGSAVGRGSARIALLAGLLGAGVAAGTWTATLSHPTAVPRDAIYTPVALRRALTRNPAAWLGRVVWVRARAEHSFVWACQHDYLCVRRRPSLADPAANAADARLLLAMPTEPALAALARRIPLMGAVVARFVTPADGLAWGRVAIYHIQLTLPAACADPSCVVARLVDVR